MTAPGSVPFWDITEAAEALGVNPKTLRRWDAIQWGPRATRVGLKRVYRYDPDECLRWLREMGDEDTVEIKRQREVA